MIRDNYLDIGKFVKNKEVYSLFNAVESHGGIIRFVGGCVRDAIKGIKDADVDLATDLAPEELVEACEEFNIKTIPIGIKFGTIGVIISDRVLEVTSLRKDIATDGRHAIVEFTNDWEVDASRRDLTINAVYADIDGNVFDYYDGIDDLENGVIRFIGSPNLRIKEDYLRILRFFRFYSTYSKTPINQKALDACKENAEGLKQLSMERIRDELKKLLLTPNAVHTIKLMSDNDILAHIMPCFKNFDNFEFLVKMIKDEQIVPNFLRKLFILYTPDVSLAENLAIRLKFTKKQKQTFVKWAELDPKLEEFLDKKSLSKLLYLHGKEFCENKLLLKLSIELKEINNLKEILSFTSNFEAPIMPVKGIDIINSGIENHHMIGAVLEKLENNWLDSNFSLSKDELLKLI